jgi:hypothetical protein
VSALRLRSGQATSALVGERGCVEHPAPRLLALWDLNAGSLLVSDGLPGLHDLRFAHLAVAVTDEHEAVIYATTYLLS